MVYPEYENHTVEKLKLGGGSSLHYIRLLLGKLHLRAETRGVLENDEEV